MPTTYTLKYELKVSTRLEPAAEEDTVLEFANELEAEMEEHLLEGEHLRLVGVERKKDQR